MKLYGTPLRYPGGKQKLTPFVREVLECNGLVGGHYAEPYAGGAGVAIELLLTGDVAHIHLNDICFPIYAFWRSVVYRTEALCERIMTIPLNVEEWRKQKEILTRPWEFTQIDVGFAFFYLNRCNRSGILNGGPIGGMEQNGNYKIHARFPREALAERVTLIGERRADITLTNWDAERFVMEHAPTLPQKSLCYCDPPYFHKANRLYLNHYTPADHKRVAAVIQKKLNRPWLISYDYAPEILPFYNSRWAFSYDLQYNARDAYKGRELVLVSDDLVLPKRSSLSFIDSALESATKLSIAPES
jgi:DNA adenine methylase